MFFFYVMRVPPNINVVQSLYRIEGMRGEGGFRDDDMEFIYRNVIPRHSLIYKILRLFILHVEQVKYN